MLFKILITYFKLIQKTQFRLSLMEHKYKEGDIVFAKVNPTLKLKVRRYVSRVYFCQIFDDPNSKELVYFERELL